MPGVPLAASDPSQGAASQVTTWYVPNRSRQEVGLTSLGQMEIRRGRCAAGRGGRRGYPAPTRGQYMSVTWDSVPGAGPPAPPSPAHQRPGGRAVGRRRATPQPSRPSPPSPDSACPRAGRRRTPPSTRMTCRTWGTGLLRVADPMAGARVSGRSRRRISLRSPAPIMPPGTALNRRFSHRTNCRFDFRRVRTAQAAGARCRQGQVRRSREAADDQEARTVPVSVSVLLAAARMGTAPKTQGVAATCAGSHVPAAWSKLVRRQSPRIHQNTTTSGHA